MLKFREREKIKARKRRGKGLLTALLVLMTLALLTVGVISLFKIRTVEITGNSFYSAQEPKITHIPVWKMQQEE